MRGADGRLRPARDTDIGDIWAHQKRLQLKEAIQTDEKKRARKQRGTNGTRAIEIKVRVPDMSWRSVTNAFNGMRRKVPKVALSRRQKFIAAACLIVIAGVIAGLNLLKGNSPDVADKDGKAVAGALDTGEGLTVPNYPTFLPAGKSIEDLGGWGRVSPPDKEPAFAFIDNVGGVRLNVSQQRLPDRFKEHTSDEVRKLAEQFSANEKVTVGDTAAYVGTSAQGPQSAVLAKGDTLILIKSEAELTKEQWMAYIGSLQ